MSPYLIKIFLTIILVINFINISIAQNTKDTLKKESIFSTIAPSGKYFIETYF